jgi:hypothetical protein
MAPYQARHLNPVEGTDIIAATQINYEFIGKW